jgi:hypothetical protein
MSYGEFADFLDASLRVLRDRVPVAYDRLCAQLSDSPILLRVDRSSFVLTVSENQLTIVEPHDAPVLEIAVSKSVVLDLLDAKTTLLDAIREDRLFLKGSVQSLPVFFSALQTYVRGALRSASFETLLASYRQNCAPRSDPHS